MSHDADCSYTHKSVMLEEALELLALRPGLSYVDATLGLAGHFLEIARRVESGIVLGIDRDQTALDLAKQKIAEAPNLSSETRLVHGNFADIDELVTQQGLSQITGGILADIGVSSMQLDDASRGFSFQSNAPLDMRMDTSRGQTAADLVNSASEKELSDILFIYGEEKASRIIARYIIAARPVSTTHELAEIVTRALRRSGRNPSKDRSNPATRTFQALRIAVNDELGSLEKFIRAAVTIMAPGARLAVITFHSLEDRLVKQIFKQYASTCVCPPRQPICTCSQVKELQIITNKPLQPSSEEILANPRSRSAKLRAGERVMGAANAG